MFTRHVSLLCLLIAVFASSCQKKKAKEEVQPIPAVSDPEEIVFQYPSYFSEPVFDFKATPLTKKGIELGRMLFYDPILSRDSTISCASCHQPYSAFSHLAHPLSHGIDRQLGNRNAPPLVNLAWSPGFMWDGVVPNLEVVSVVPITNPMEMDETVANVLKKLNRHPVYKAKFKEAFKQDSISSSQMLKAMAQFLVSIVSFDSKYDQYKQGKITLDSVELKGLKIVQQKCTPCHGGELFTDFGMRNIGMDTTLWVTDDLGRESFTKQFSDRRKFKTPSLRNFEITSPYLHDGRAFSFNAAMDQHDHLIQDNPNLDPWFKKNGQTGIKLSVEERLTVYQFIKTLTDESMSGNPAYLTPFDSYIIIH